MISVAFAFINAFFVCIALC